MKDIAIAVFMPNNIEGHFTNGHVKKRTRFCQNQGISFKDFLENKGIFAKGVRDF